MTTFDFESAPVFLHLQQQITGILLHVSTTLLYTQPRDAVCSLWKTCELFPISIPMKYVRVASTSLRDFRKPNSKRQLCQSKLLAFPSFCRLRVVFPEGNFPINALSPRPLQSANMGERAGGLCRRLRVILVANSGALFRQSAKTPAACMPAPRY